jgi:hypothetical protein
MTTYTCPYCDGCIGVKNIYISHLSQIIGGHLSHCTGKRYQLIMNKSGIMLDNAHWDWSQSEPVMFESDVGEAKSTEISEKSVPLSEAQFNKIYLAFQVAVDACNNAHAKLMDLFMTK